MESTITYPTWEQSRQKLIGYARRAPEETILYRTIYHYRQDLEYQWEDVFQSNYGTLRREVLQAFDAYLNCGILAHGCARAYCDNCKHSALIAFSCKRRGLCPSCDTKRGLIFAEHLDQNILLALPHRHLVFTLPKRLRIYFKFNRQLCKYLYTAAWGAWSNYLSQLLPHLPLAHMPQAKPGAIMALHTAGDLLHFHPHIHALALDGVIDSNGLFTRLPQCDLALIQAEFENQIFNALLKEELITDETVNTMRSWDHSGFSVYSAEPIEATDHDARLFVARYLKKSPIALDRLSIDESAPEPKIVCKRKLDDSEETRSFSPLEFLAELSTHIPNSWEQTTRFYGVYAARTRPLLEKADLMLQAGTEIPQEPPEPSPELIESTPSTPVSKYWAHWIKKVYEVDPLQCPKCGSNMRIVALIHDPKEIKKLTTHLGIPQYRAPPPLKTPSLERRIIPDSVQPELVD